MEPGRHVVVLEYHWNVGDLTNYVKARIDEPVVRELDAREGRIYRARYRVYPDEIAWIEDVTDEELGLPSHEPSAPISKDIAKSQRKSTIIVRIAPAYTDILLKPGRTRGIFIQNVGYGPWLRPKKGATFAIGSLRAGETAGFVLVNLRGKGFSIPVQLTACDSVHVPVYEHVPGGQVLYLGRFDFELVPEGYSLRFSQDDLESVRAELAAEHPDLASKLRVASFRMARVAQPCLSIYGRFVPQLVEGKN